MAEDKDARDGRGAGAVGGLLTGLADKALKAAADKVSHKIDDTAHSLLDKAKQEDGGGPGVQAAMSGLGALSEGKGPVRAALSAGMSGLTAKLKGSGGKKKLKLTNIVETIDVGAPLQLTYNQWTQFEDFPTFTKKVEQADQSDDMKVHWKAQVFWSHREWEATILEQVPDSHIIWRSKGAKGHVDGAVSFTELGPNLTRVCLVMEYHPQGFFERTGNLWRAQGRRARLELKHFARHVMVHALADPDQVEGWRGEIRDGEVVSTGEETSEDERANGSAEEAEESAHEHDGQERPQHEHEEEHRRPREHAEHRRPREHEEDGEGHRGREREREPAREGSEREGADPRRARRRPPEPARQPARRRPAEAEDRPRVKQPAPRAGR
ncbi:hypothetical protein GCM10022221_29880 [Actinocorallia aurea]